MSRKKGSLDQEYQELAQALGFVSEFQMFTALREHYWRIDMIASLLGKTRDMIMFRFEKYNLSTQWPKISEDNQELVRQAVQISRELNSL